MKPREFLLGESVNGWYIKELCSIALAQCIGTKDFEPTTFLDRDCLRVREVRAIDWQGLWVDYDEWQMDHRGKVHWDEMTNKIQELVDKQLAGEE